MGRPGSRALEHERMLRAEAETLNELAHTLTLELDLQTLLQKVTDRGTELTAAKFGVFSHNLVNEQGELYVLHTVSGLSPEDFEKFGLSRKEHLFDPAFCGTGVVRMDDLLQDPRYARSTSHHGLPKEYLLVRSYLAVPVVPRSGELLVGLFFGHPKTGVFSESAEPLAIGVAAQAAIAIGNAQLYGQAKREIGERVLIEAA